MYETNIHMSERRKSYSLLKIQSANVILQGIPMHNKIAKNFLKPNKCKTTNVIRET